MDVKCAFYNDELKEMVFVKHPTGFVNEEYPNYCYILLSPVIRPKTVDLQVRFILYNIPPFLEPAKNFKLLLQELHPDFSGAVVNKSYVV